RPARCPTRPAAVPSPAAAAAVPGVRPGGCRVSQANWRAVPLLCPMWTASGGALLLDQRRIQLGRLVPPGALLELEPAAADDRVEAQRLLRLAQQRGEVLARVVQRLINV